MLRRGPNLGSPGVAYHRNLEEVAGGTRVTHSILHGSREPRDGHLKAGMEAEAFSSYDVSRNTRCEWQIFQDGTAEDALEALAAPEIKLDLRQHALSW